MPKLLIIIILLWLAIAGVIIFLIIPLAQACFDLQKANLEREKTVADLTKILPEVEKLKNDYQAHQAQAEKVRSALPAEEEIPELISELTALTARNGVVMANFAFSIGGTSSAAPQVAVSPPGAGAGATSPIMSETPSPTSPAAATSGPSSPVSSGTAFYRLITINLGVTGSYQALQDFLKDIEKDLRLLDTRTLNLSPVNQESSAGEAVSADLFSLDLSLETYFLPNKK